MTGYIGSLLGQIYGIAQKADEISANPMLLTFAVVLGVITSVVAALIPARSAARVDPVQALQKGKYQQLSAGENRVRRLAALVVAAGGCRDALLFERFRIFFYIGDALAVLAALLLTPTFALWLARALRPLLRWMRPVEGTLAADSLLQAPRRTSGAVAALMLSLALVVALGGLARASYDSIYGWLTVALNPDLFVSPSQSLTQRDFRFPESMGAQLRAIPGVGEVQLVRDARIEIQGKPAMFVAADIRRSAESMPRLPPVAGNANEMFRRAEQGEAVLASENFALLRGFKLGDIVDIPTPRRRPASPDRRNRHRLFRRARQLADGSLALQTLLERQHGEHLPHLSCARRSGGRCEAANSREVRRTSAGCSCSPIEKCGVIFCGSPISGSASRTCRSRSRCWWRSWASSIL